MAPEYPQFTSGYLSAAVQSCPPAAKMPSIPEAFAVLGKMTEENLELARQLADRLQSALRAATPAVDCGAKLNSNLAAVPMVNQIEGIQDSAHAVSALLRSLLDRIEL